MGIFEGLPVFIAACIASILFVVGMLCIFSDTRSGYRWGVPLMWGSVGVLVVLAVVA